MSFDIDTLRNQLLACRQRSIELDQARIDAEMALRVAVASERVAVDRLRVVEVDAANHVCPPDVRGRVRELEAKVKALQAQAASLRAELGRSAGTATRLQTELDATQARLADTRKALAKPEPVNERLLMRVKQLEAEHGRNQR